MTTFSYLPESGVYGVGTYGTSLYGVVSSQVDITGFSAVTSLGTITTEVENGVALPALTITTSLEPFQIIIEELLTGFELSTALGTSTTTANKISLIGLAEKYSPQRTILMPKTSVTFDRQVITSKAA